MAKNKNEKPTVTRAEKTDAAKKLIRSLLEQSSFKSNDLIDEAAKLYAQQFVSEDTPNSVKGRIGSVIDVMKKDGEILFEEGMYALKTEIKTEENKEEKKATQAEKPKKTTKTGTKKTVEKVEEKAGETPQEEKAEKPVKTRATKKSVKEKAEKEEKAEEKQPLPTPPLQPIAPVAPVTPENAPEPIPAEEKPKKRGRKPKAEKVEEKAVETVAEEKPQAEEKAQAEVKEEKTAKTETVVEEKKAQAPKANVVDMSFLLGSVAAKKELPKREEPKQITQKAESLVEKTQTAQPQAQTSKPVAKETPNKEVKPVVKKTQTVKKVERMTVKKPTRPLTADEKLQEAYLKRLRKLGGDYFEYYSVYLLERYSRMNGRRLEGLKITGGDHDGGIDGEIEVTDRLGFRETIYIQAKNWDPDKGDERLWVVGETLLQQFIGACVCRQAKDGKQHCRGIFITTSRFTAEAKKILEDTADKFVGYDGADLYEAAKECSFGVMKKNGEWVLDEELLSGEKAFFKMY